MAEGVWVVESLRMIAEACQYVPIYVSEVYGIAPVRHTSAVVDQVLPVCAEHEV